jgi:Fe-S-cluster containining protein
MVPEKKKAKLRSIYESFDDAVAEFRKHAVCGKGCNFYCTRLGNVDIVTLEGVMILERLEEMEEDVQKEVAGRIARNRTERKEGTKPACPFQDEGGPCLIYEVRPFSCRQHYSLRKCDSGGPLVHRQAAKISQATVKEIQRLDDTGYSGHISFILHLLGMAEFRKIYLIDGFNPAMIADFGKSHGIIINRFAK